jgi:hypothetical protein
MDSSRRIWLLTNSAKPITLLDERTDSVLQIGRRGQGPGDTRFAWIFASTSSNPSEAPDLFDIGGRKVVHYTVDGRATENVLRFLGPSSVMDSFRESSYGLPRRMMAMRSGWIWNEFSGFVSSGKDLWPLSLLRADFSGHVDTIYHRTAPVELTLKPEQQFFIPVPLVSRCNDSLFVVYLNEPDTLFWLDDSGRQLDAAATGLDRTAVKLPNRLAYIRERAEFENRRSLKPMSTAQLDAYVRSAAGRSESVFAKNALRASSILCNAEGTVLLVPFTQRDDADTATRRVLSMNRQGGREQLWLPAGFEPFALTPGSLWGVDDRDAAGARVVGLKMPHRN